MIPTSVHGYMPFVKETQKPMSSKQKKIAIRKEANFDGSISRMKVLKIRSNERLENIPVNIKEKILTKDKTWYAVVRALFRKSGHRQNRCSSSSSSNSDSTTKLSSNGSLKTLKNLRKEDKIKFSSPINESPITGSTTIYPPIKINETTRSKSMRLASIEEEVDETFMNMEELCSLSHNFISPGNSNIDRPPRSDQMKRRDMSELIKMHEEVASLSSNSSHSLDSDSSFDSFSAPF